MSEMLPRPVRVRISLWRHPGDDRGGVSRDTQSTGRRVQVAGRWGVECPVFEAWLRTPILRDLGSSGHLTWDSPCVTSV